MSLLEDKTPRKFDAQGWRGCGRILLLHLIAWVKEGGVLHFIRPLLYPPVLPYVEVPGVMSQPATIRTAMIC